jgi:transposase
MRWNPRDYSAETERRLQELLKRAKDRDEARRIQSVHLWIKHGWTSEEIAEAVGLHPVSVRKLWQRFRNEGEACFKTKPKGGRHRNYLKPDQEKACLQTCFEEAQAGHILIAKHVRKTLEKRIGHPIAVATVYRILHRNKWRKVEPRPQHPKADQEVMAAFKKTSTRTSKKPG